MNEARRKRLTALKDQFDALKSELEEIRDEEQDYFDNMPESFQGGDKGDKAQEAITLLDDGCNSIESVMDSIEQAVET